MPASKQEMSVTNQSTQTSGTAVCLYHNDADGRCSAAIIRRALGTGVLMRAMDYGFRAVPWDDLKSAAKVLIVDFALPLEDMQRIKDNSELIWIDHHKSAIEELASLSDLPGLRSMDEAACVLTWQHFFVDQPLPDAVKYIGDRDVWRHAFEETTTFGEGLFQEDTSPANDALWQPLLEGDSELIDKLIAHGKILHRARLKRIWGSVTHEGFEVQFEGHRTLVINNHGSGEMGEYSRQRGYEIAYCYVDRHHEGKLITRVTLFSEQVDVSQIARKFGGGGHAGAAGFSFERVGRPFPPGADVVMTTS
jgi:oligoribonuclease NrnB/cAMP/cGMP phosphodiesterase (DHH superfamily)